MTDQGLTDADRARIAHFLSKPRYDRTYRDLLPADEQDVHGTTAGDDTDGSPVRDADDRDEDD